MSQIRIILNTLKLIFTKTIYIVLVVSLFVIFTLVNFFINILILNYDLLSLTLTSGIFNWESKIKVIINSIISINILPIESIVIIFILSSLIAMEISVFIFYLKNRLIIKPETNFGILGLPLAFLGVGCSACGSLVLTSLIGLSTASVLIGFLPLAGLEFELLGIFILLASIYLIVLKISLINNCKI